MSIPFWHGKDRASILLDNKYLPFLVGIMALFIAIGGYGVYSVKKEIEGNLIDQLQFTLATNIESLQLFFEDKKLDAQVLADQDMSGIISSIEFAILEPISENVPPIDEASAANPAGVTSSRFNIVLTLVPIAP